MPQVHRFFMIKLIALACIACLLVMLSCNEGAKTSTETETTVTTNEEAKPETPMPEPKPEEPVPSGISGCYMQVMSRDTFAARLQQSGNNITGKLTFDNYQKDGSTGTVTGKMDGNILKLLYSFASEGMNSVMEVYYKVDNGKLIRGTGDINVRGDTAYYANPSAIKFEGRGLQMIDCNDVPSKYK